MPTKLLMLLLHDPRVDALCVLRAPGSASTCATLVTGRIGGSRLTLVQLSGTRVTTLSKWLGSEIFFFSIDRVDDVSRFTFESPSTIDDRAKRPHRVGTSADKMASNRMIGRHGSTTSQFRHPIGLSLKLSMDCTSRCRDDLED
jgi:hypothetical protein